MGEFDWISDLVKRHLEIQKLTTDQEEIVVVKSRRKTTVFYRRRGEMDFSEASARKKRRLLEKVHAERSSVELLSI